MTVNLWRRAARGPENDPEAVLADARKTVTELKGLLGTLRLHLAELEEEVRSQTNPEEG